ncbi:MAG: hypothetical protein J6C65_05215 [Prevotella sp.]|nr:hypothetical protein [Prevotella sp.]
MSDISINIYGGSNQILPNATKAEQHIYGDQLAERVLQFSDSEHPLSGEAQRLAIYINKVEDLKGYLSMLSACTTAKEIGEVVAVMAQKEPRLTKDEICKARFISLLPPLAPKVTDGITVDNLRIHIDNAVAIRKKAGNIR